MKKCFISDHTHVWTDELKPVAEYLKVLELYEKTKYNVTYQTIRDNGKLCMEAWQKGQLEKAIAHNRSCLLKERDILLRRGFRKPNQLNFVNG